MLLVLACGSGEIESTGVARTGGGSEIATPSWGGAIDPPAVAGAFAPNLAVVEGELAATWLEPAELSTTQSITDSETTEGHRLRFSRLGTEGWSEPITVAEGEDFFANWADFPAAIEAGEGTLYAHWLEKTAEDTYAYSIFLARSADGGESWVALGKLNSDSTPTEHGFVAFVPEEEGARAFWLDGRGMVDGGPMALRTAAIGVESDGGIGSEEVLDERICECCSTDAAVGAGGPIVVYRDRSEAEVRDIGVIRTTDAGWSEPALVANDDWEIAGCPVNGPEIDADGERVAVAWFTSAGDRPRVQIAFSEDSGAAFGDPVVVDDGSVLGRVDVVVAEAGGAWVSWVSQVGDHAEIKVQQVSSAGPTGEPRVVAETSAARASGFPRLDRLGERLFMAWVEVDEDRSASRVRIQELGGIADGLGDSRSAVGLAE